MIYYLTAVISFALGFGTACLLVRASRQDRYEQEPPPGDWVLGPRSEKTLCQNVNRLDRETEG